jgi:hypothetical protein
MVASYCLVSVDEVTNDLQMAMVSNKFLSALSVKLGFHRHLRSHSPAILNAITEYVAELEECERQSEGKRDYWTLAKNPPKVTLPYAKMFCQ